jgi:hypothetical protein
LGVEVVHLHRGASAGKEAPAPEFYYGCVTKLVRWLEVEKGECVPKKGAGILSIQCFGASLLAEFLAVWREYNGHMCVVGCLVTEALLQVDLARG